MDTTGIKETTGITNSKVAGKKEHFKASLIDFTAGSLGKLNSRDTVNFTIGL